MSSLLLLFLMALGQLMLNVSYANGNNNNNNNNNGMGGSVGAQMVPRGGPNSDSSAHGSDASHGSQGIPRFNSVQELCQWLCQRQSPNFDYGCPPSCDGGVLGAWSKRAARGRRMNNDDFSFGFDDYLFMKLLGRDLGDRV